jgi:pyruvate formate lyase activating enzyme
MKYFDQDRQGTVLRIERSSVHDGQGFRTVVFLKGCPLRCQWCSTPESQSFGVEHTAAGTYGGLMTVGQVMREVVKDSLFFFVSKGGVTLSGGEVLAQPEFCLALLKNAKREGLDTAIETCLYGPWEHMSAILPYLNTAYADVKLIDPEAHKTFCGVSNELILENLRRLDREPGSTRIVVRTPIIPSINDTQEELERLGKFCAGLKNLDHIQLLPYHRLGTATYEKLGRPYLLGDVKTPTQAQMERCKQIIGTFGVRCL